MGIDPDKKEFGAWWMWILGLVMVSSIVLTGLNYAGIFSRTVVERKVFENSYQYTEARKTEIATYEAQLAELESRLNNPQLDEDTRANIEAQMSAIRIQLSVARSRQ